MYIFIDTPGLVRLIQTYNLNVQSEKILFNCIRHMTFSGLLELNDTGN